MTESGQTYKVERYGWNAPSEFGSRGKFMMLKKSILGVDDKYQREQAPLRVRRIAAQFTWQKFGCIIVGRRSNGKFFVIDGGHRLQAALSRDDIADIPCLVFEDTERKGEALSFLGANKNRRCASGIDIFKAQLCGQEQPAKNLQLALAKFGLSIGDKATETTMNGPQTLIELNERGQLVPALAFIATVWPSDELRTRTFVAASVAVFAYRLEKDTGLTLKSPDVISSFRRVAIGALIQSGSVYFMQKRTSRVEAFGGAMRDHWNRRRDKNRIGGVLAVDDERKQG